MEITDVYVILAICTFPFKLTSAQCGDSATTLTNLTGTFTSPNYPHPYPSDSDCKWIIEAPPGNRVVLTFTYVSIEQHADCNYDSIVVYDGQETTEDKRIERFCDSFNYNTQGTSHTIMSTNNTMMVNFISDRVVQRSGFQANYTFMSNVMMPGVGRMKRDNVIIIDSPNGTVASPNFARHYPRNMRLVYNFTFGINQRLVIGFTTFELEGQNREGNCADFVRVRNVNWKIYGQHCGKDVPPRYSFYGGRAYLMFYSDGSKTARGFELNYKVFDIQQCLEDSAGLTYTGTHNITGNGSLCERWDSDISEQSGFSRQLDQENFCRNPNNQTRPWCFGKVSQTPEFCNIPLCGSTTHESDDITNVTTTGVFNTSTNGTTTPHTEYMSSSSTVFTTSTSTEILYTTSVGEETDKPVLPFAERHTDTTIIAILVPLLAVLVIIILGLLIFGYVIMKKKPNFSFKPVTQLRSIVNPNYVSKESIQDGYMVSYENMEIARQSKTAARESVIRMKRRKSGVAVDSVYSTVEEDPKYIGITDESKLDSSDDTPYVDKQTTYDMLRRKRTRRVDARESKTYGHLSLMFPEETYDHTKTQSRVEDVYAVVNKGDRTNSKTGINRNSHNKEKDTEQIPTEKNQSDDVYAVVDKTTKHGSNDSPRRNAINDQSATSYQVTNDNYRTNSETSDDAQKKQVHNIKDKNKTPNTSDEEVYVERDNTYDQLRRKRTKRLKNQGVDVRSIYSEVRNSIAAEENVYDKTEGYGRISQFAEESGEKV